ncbi:TNT domain-containing protein [Nonomuraea sp. FMUSA5-5]
MTGWRDRIGTWYAWTYDDQGRCTAGTGIDGIFDTAVGYADRVTTARDYGLVRSWFGQPGGGFQILRPDGIDLLLKNGDIRVVL